MYLGVFISLLVGLGWRDGGRDQKLALLAQDKGEAGLSKVTGAVVLTTEYTETG